ncbi:MAG: hypothetical protein ABFR33_03370 [Verrucomicrobiota bacterium]
MKKILWLLAAVVVSVCANAFEPEPVRLVNFDFDEGLKGWTVEEPHQIFGAGEHAGRTAAWMKIGDDVSPDWHNVIQMFVPEPGALYEATATLRVANVRHGIGAAVVFQYFDAEGERIGWDASRESFHRDEWFNLKVRGRAPEKATSMQVLFQLNGRGEVYCDRIELFKVAPPVGPVPAKVEIAVSDKVVNDSIDGFGFEDDGWLYNKENAEKGGLDEKDYALMRERIEWMQPGYVRMFAWYGIWNPSRDWKTFDFENDGMTSYCRTLDLYQKLGAKVNIAGVEWNFEKWPRPEQLANSIASYVEHMVKEKGFTCIKQWTLTNEPNLHLASTGGNWNLYKAYHQAVAAEFKKRGLDIEVVGSDETGCLSWTDRCVQDDEYHKLCGAYSAHFYINDVSFDQAYLLIKDHTDLIRSKGSDLEFIVGEYGFLNERTKAPMENILAEEYPYAVQNHSFGIDALNAGADAIAYWCLHEVYYPGKRMTFGLWNYKDRGWGIRPVYHSHAAFTRFTSSGDTVYKCTTGAYDHFKAAATDNAIFWVNVSDAQIEVSVVGFAADKVQIMTEENITASDRDVGKRITGLADSVFTAPPQSFGYILGKRNR